MIFSGLKKSQGLSPVKSGSCALVLTLGFIASVPANSASMYTITDVGFDSRGYGINNHGQITGTADLFGSSNSRAFIYSNGVVTDLGTLGGSFSRGEAINEAGQVVGYSWLPESSNATSHAFYYDGISVTDIGAVGGTDSYARDINEFGVATGYQKMDGGGTYAFTYDPVTGLTDIGTLDGGVFAHGNGINDAGMVTGPANEGPMLPVAYRYDGSELTSLGKLDGASYASGHAINNHGVVVGDSSGEAFISDGDEIRSLGTHDGRNSFAWGINDQEQVVGELLDDVGPRRAFLYEGGAMYDLNTLIDTSDPLFGLVNLNSAYDINELGQIVGNMTINGETHAFIATPVPLPATVWMLISGLFGFGVMRKILSVN